MDNLIDDIVADPGVGKLLAPADPVIAPSLLVKALLELEGFDAVTRPKSTPPAATLRLSGPSTP